MSVTAIVLSHFKEREKNMMRILNSLELGTVIPDRIIFFIDNPGINFLEGTWIPNVSVIRTDENYPVMIRYALGLTQDTDYCLFIDDDLMVGKKTVENFLNYAQKYPNSILGLEGNQLAVSTQPYTKGTTIDRGHSLIPADIIIRTYFVPQLALINFFSVWWRYRNRLPKSSVDDIILCLANDSKFVIPVNKESDVIELTQGRKGQQFNPDHYINRDKACLILRNINT